MITYIIIDKLYEQLEGFNCNICTIITLFFADDGLLLMKTHNETIESIQLITEIACGLSVNKQKSNILIYNVKEQPQDIDDIPVKQISHTLE